MNAADNGVLRRILIERVRRDFVPRGAAIEVQSDWEILDYSSCFWVGWHQNGSPEGAYVKIPKTEIDRRTVAPQVQADRELARNEYASLCLLQRHWLGEDLRVTAVRPLAFYEDLNAIVTGRAYAADLLTALRRADLRGYLSQGHRAAVADALRRVGLTLARFHQSTAASIGSYVVADTDPLICRTRRVLQDIALVGGPAGVLSRLEHVLAELPSISVNRMTGATLKGLDVRNLLADATGGVHVLDPGKTKSDLPEADVARLVVTLRIAWWGTVLFAARARPGRSFEDAILAGYESTSPLDRRILERYVVKELAKQWRATYVAIGRKGWPAGPKWAMQRTYADRFYVRELNAAARGLWRSESPRQSLAFPI